MRVPFPLVQNGPAIPSLVKVGYAPLGTPRATNCILQFEMFAVLL